MQPFRRHTDAVHKGTKHRIGIKAAAVLAADSPMMALQKLLHMVEQPLPKEEMQCSRCHGRRSAGQRVVGAGLDCAI
jgi:hypothetical protein